MPVQKIRKYLQDNNIPFESIPHERTFTAQETAQVTHISGKELVKAVVVKADGKDYLLAIPASRRVNLEKVKRAVGAKDAHLEDESTFGDLFPGCALGAMPPLGKLFNMDLLADEGIRQDREIAFNAGTHTEVLKMSRVDFDHLESPRYAPLAFEGT